jgi:hypothetical protein
MAFKRSKPDGATSLSNLKVTPRYLHPDYKLQEDDLKRGETGLLRVFCVTPTNVRLPSFSARIDDGSSGYRKQPELDIDIEGVSKAIARYFKKHLNGYGGHHADRSTDPGHRLFDVKIVVPSGKIFEGEVSFNVHFTMLAETGMYQSVGMEMSVTRASGKPKSE